MSGAKATMRMIVEFGLDGVIISSGWIEFSKPAKSELLASIALLSKADKKRLVKMLEEAKNGTTPQT